MNEHGYELKPMQKAVARLLALGQFTKEQVAEECGISVSTIHRWYADPRVEFEKYVNELADVHSVETMKVHAEARQAFDNLVMDATDRLKYLMTESRSESVQAKCALDIIHLAGLKPADKHEIEGRHTEILSFVDPSQDSEDYTFDEDDGGGDDPAP